MVDGINGLPGLTPEVFREFIELVIKHYVSEAKNLIAEVFRGKNRFITYEIRDIGISFQAEVTEDGDCLIHLEPLCESGMRYIAEAETFDDIMTTRASPSRAFLEKRVEIVGLLGDAISFMPAVPFLQKAYIRARRKMIDRYGLEELARKYPVPSDYEERLG